MAVALLREEYERHALQKTASRPDPLTSYLGMVDAMSRVGQFGLSGDAYSAWLNRDTERPFDVDSRVYVLSTMRSASRALYQSYASGAADYQTAWHPMISALGGSG